MMGEPEGAKEEDSVGKAGFDVTIIVNVNSHKTWSHAEKMLL